MKSPYWRKGVGRVCELAILSPPLLVFRLDLRRRLVSRPPADIKQKIFHKFGYQNILFAGD